MSVYRFRSIRTVKVSVCSVCSQTANLALCQVIDSGLYEPLKWSEIFHSFFSPDFTLTPQLKETITKSKQRFDEATGSLDAHHLQYLKMTRKDIKQSQLNPDSIMQLVIQVGRPALSSYLPPSIFCVHTTVMVFWYCSCRCCSCCIVVYFSHFFFVLPSLLSHLSHFLPHFQKPWEAIVSWSCNCQILRTLFFCFSTILHVAPKIDQLITIISFLRSDRHFKWLEWKPLGLNIFWKSAGFFLI